MLSLLGERSDRRDLRQFEGLEILITDQGVTGKYCANLVCCQFGHRLVGCKLHLLSHLYAYS